MSCPPFASSAISGSCTDRVLKGGKAVAALGLGVFLLSIPAHFGALTRTRVGFVLEKDTALRLTPTAEAEAGTRLAAGEPARWVRTRGNYLFIRTSRNAGWIERGQFGLICSK